MRNRYTYLIEINRGDGTWRLSRRASQLFSRDPKSVARAILEQWIIGHPDQVRGGERISVHGPAAAPHLENPGASVRVTVLDQADDESAVPVAVAYLGHDERDLGSPRRSTATVRLLQKGRRQLGRRLRGGMSEAA